MRALGYNIGTASSTVLCKLFGDNSGDMALDRYLSMRPRGKYINVKYQHFREYAANYTIYILPIESSKQPEDTIMHPLNEYAFTCHIISIMG